MNRPTGKLSKIIALHRQEFTQVEETDGNPLKHPAGISRTESVELLRLEAEMQAEGRELENPHIPLDEETLEAAKEQIKQDGNSPAWKQ